MRNPRRRDVLCVNQQSLSRLVACNTRSGYNTHHAEADVRFPRPHFMCDASARPASPACDKGIQPSRGLIIARDNMTRVPLGIYKCSPLYSDLAWLRKTQLTYTYLSKRLSRGHQTSHTDFLFRSARLAYIHQACP